MKESEGHFWKKPPKSSDQRWNEFSGKFPLQYWKLNFSEEQLKETDLRRFCNSPSGLIGYFPFFPSSLVWTLWVWMHCVCEIFECELVGCHHCMDRPQSPRVEGVVIKIQKQPLTVLHPIFPLFPPQWPLDRQLTLTHGRTCSFRWSGFTWHSCLSTSLWLVKDEGLNMMYQDVSDVQEVTVHPTGRCKHGMATYFTSLLKGTLATLNVDCSPFCSSMTIGWTVYIQPGPTLWAQLSAAELHECRQRCPAQTCCSNLCGQWVARVHKCPLRFAVQTCVVSG